MTWLIGSERTQFAIAWHTQPGRPPDHRDDWLPVFKGWAKAQLRYLHQVSDPGWIYGERAQMGFLTTGIWAAGGTALTEYKGVKRDRNDLRYRKTGWGDLYACLNGYTLAAEAKFERIRMDTRGTAETVYNAMARAADDAHLVTARADHLGAVVFASIRTEETDPAGIRKELREYRKLNLRETITEHFARGFQVDFFPTRPTEVSAQDEEGYTCPGMTLFFALEPRR